MRKVLFVLLILLSYSAYAGSGEGVSVSVSLTSMPPDTPQLCMPTHEATNIADSTALVWYSQIHTSRFNLQLSTTEDFSTSLVDEAGISDTLFNVSDLDHETLHYWRVNAINAAGTSDYSSVWYFTTLKAAAAAPTLHQPKDGSMSLNPNVELKWNRVAGALSYHLQVSDQSDFSSIVLEQTTLNDSFFTCTTLQRETLYYWRVSATNEGGEGVFSTAWNFTTIPEVADAPVLSQPADASTNVDPNIELCWNSAIGAISYHLQISDHINFSTLTIDSTGLTNTWYQVELETEKVWYWRISSINEGGEGEFSNYWTFSTWATGVDESEIMPKSFALLPVYPNPFNPTAFITYHLPKTAEISLTIYNSVGQRIRDLAAGQQHAGRYTIQWDGHDNYGYSVTSGMYLCRFSSGDHVFVQKMLLLR